MSSAIILDDADRFEFPVAQSTQMKVSLEDSCASLAFTVLHKSRPKKVKVRIPKGLLNNLITDLQKVRDELATEQ